MYMYLIINTVSFMITFALESVAVNYQLAIYLKNTDVVIYG